MKQIKRFLSLSIVASLCMMMLQVPTFANSTYTYSIGPDAIPILPVEGDLTIDRVYVSMKSPIDGGGRQEWHNVGILSLTIEGLGKTEEELKTQKVLALSPLQQDEIMEQVLAQTCLLTGPATEEILSMVRWTELKYEASDEGRADICPWHLDGEIDFFPAAFFLRKDNTFVGGAQPEAHYYPSHTDEWESLTWGLLNGFAEPQEDGYHVIMDNLESNQEIEAVKEVFADVAHTIEVGPDLKNKNCPLRKTIMDNYGVSEEALDSGAVDVIWYVSKRGENCSSPCVYHVDGVVYSMPADEEPSPTPTSTPLPEGVLPATSLSPDVTATPSPSPSGPIPSPIPNPSTSPEASETTSPSPIVPIPTPSPSASILPEMTATPPPVPSVTQTEIPEPTRAPAGDIDDNNGEDDYSPTQTVVKPVQVHSKEQEDVVPPNVEDSAVEDFEEIDVPLAGLPDALLPDPVDEDLFIEDQDVPMAQVPETGDDLELWLAAMISAAMGSLWLAMRGKKASN